MESINNWMKLNYLTIATDHLLIPIEAFLTTARHGAGAIVMFINIDKTISLAVFTSGE